MSAKSQRLRRRLEISEARRAKMVKLAKISSDKEEIYKLSFKLAQATLRAWNAGQAFGNDYFKTVDGKKIVKKVAETFEKILENS